MAQLTVGLDLGNETIKRVRLKSSFRSVELVDYTEAEMPQDDRPFPERVAEALSQFGGNGQSELLATALPGNVVSVRNLELPFTDSKRISQTIGFELESLIPFSMDQIVFDYLQLAKTSRGTSQMMAALCQVEQMERWLATLQAAGMDPRLVGADCLAYSSLAEYLPPAEDTRQAIVDIGHRLTSVCVLGPAGVEFGRTLSFGGQDATTRLAETFGVDRQEAELGKHRGAFIETEARSADTPEQVQISDTLRKSVDLLVRELRQTLTTHRSLTGQQIGQI
jgi:type IV pilus assembly protein PilM